MKSFNFDQVVSVMPDYTHPQMLFNALDNGDCATVKRCLHAGQNLNQPDSNSCTLLAFHKHLDLDHRSLAGATALHYAVFINAHAAHSLIQLGADVNIKTSGADYIHIVAKHGRLSREDRQKV